MEVYMSGLYNMLFGENDKAGFLLGLLGKTAGDFGRYRDVYVTEDHIVVHTRCGGGNREDYEDVFEEMSTHPLYSYDEDDDFDCTYADIYFRHPDEYKEILKEMSKGTITPAEKWEMMFKALEQK
jgi:hypothetical protein